jgi:hypothetical protein
MLRIHTCNAACSSGLLRRKRGKSLNDGFFFDSLSAIGTSSTLAEIYCSVLYAMLTCPLVTDY